MRRVSLGKTAKENSRDMEGGLPDNWEGWPRSPLETKTSRRRIRFSALSATSPVELWVQVNMSLFFLPSYCQKLFGNIEICFSALFSWQEELNKPSFPTPNVLLVQQGCFSRAFLLNELRILNRAEKQVMHYALCWLCPVNNAIKMPEIRVRRTIWGLRYYMYLWIIPRCLFLFFLFSFLFF